MQTIAEAQDFSNKGKDFWLCFPSHVPNEKDGVFYYANMSLFITADKNSSGTVSIPGIFNTTFTVTAGQVTEVNVPYNLAHITSADAAKVIRKGIRVKVDAGKPPVVVYSHIYAGYRSAASLILPVAVLGKKYYSMNAPQVSISGSKSQFVIVAVDTNTTVLITPVRDGVKGTPITIQLPLPGDLYELQDGLDLSGSLIESVSPNSETCKPIAVFSGSSAIHIITNNQCTPGDSYDPLYQQLYPVNAWGKSYGFIPFEGYVGGNPYRVIASEDNTKITVNGNLVTTLNAGQYYPAKPLFGQVTTNPVFINADKPVSVAQYAQSSSCSGANIPVGSGYGDPDMVLLNPIEQQVNDITVFSSQKENIYSDAKFINVLIKQNATASFTINSVAPAAVWQPVLPAGSGYACAKIKLPVNLSACTLKADSAFNAIAYGFGNFESYAYSAGTNVKDLYRTLTVENEFGAGSIPIGCNNSEFYISVTFPYQPQAIRFLFYGLFADKTINNPVLTETFMMNGQLVYRYRINDAFLVNQAGSYPVTVIATNANNTGCNNGQDEIDYELTILERPKAEFTVNHSGCITDAVQFTDASTSNGPITKWYWELGDNNTSALSSLTHTYAVSNDYVIKHRVINDIGCGSDTAIKTIAITNIPVADFQSQLPSVCAGTALQFKDATTFSGNGSVVSWAWDFGDLQNNITNSATDQIHTYQREGTFTASLYVQTNSGCKSAVVQKQVQVYAVPHAAFEAPVFCLPGGTGQFLNTSTINNNATLSSQWNFGDGYSSNIASPVYQYNNVGPYTVTLTVTSPDGCIDDSAVVINSIYPKAPLQYNALSENCLNDPTSIVVTTQSNAYTSLSHLYWSESVAGVFNDTVPNVVLSECQLPVVFNTPGNKTVRVFGTTATGCNTDTVNIPVYINRLPVANFQPSAPLCAGKNIYFNDLSSAIDGTIQKWSWDFGNGILSSEQHPQLAFGTGNITASLIVESSKGCRSTTAVQALPVAPLPVADFDAPVTCVADPYVLFTNKSAGGLLYKWHFGDANATPANPDVSLLQQPTHSYSIAGNYNVRLQVTSIEGCEADTTMIVKVNGASVQAAFSSQAFPAICNDKPVLLQDASSVDAGSIIRREIYWNYDNDPLQKTTDNNPQAASGYQFQYPATTTDIAYHIKYVVYSGAACLHQLDSMVIINRMPSIQFDPLTGVCEDHAAFYVNTAKETSGINGNGWYVGNGVSVEGLFTPAQAGAGVHPLSYSFTANNGCSTVAQQPIEVYALPILDAGPDRTVKAGTAIQLPGVGKGEQLQYQWSPALFIDDVHIARPIAIPETDITYTLTATSGKGCIAKDEVTIKVIDKIPVPNAFTPNNDGKNDTWKIPYLEMFENCSVRVYNRWGELVFNSNGYFQPWDGTRNGQQLPVGTYTYIIDCKNGAQPLKGVVMLIR
ncbi:PKD domain-containing protein [Niastella sp. OAS944]|uniref:PKD domain-containing protein n=1 Tax=Niastella sp. OAS944 TaxID=2664089 RepID=UPI0035C79A1B|nr:gliding motility-associated-like protein [Chitinophagaceae bacterium OAS944]